jgi:hypothetical protein
MVLRLRQLALQVAELGIIQLTLNDKATVTAIVLRYPVYIRNFVNTNIQKAIRLAVPCCSSFGGF